MITDKYTNFYFNGKNSEDMKVFITNNNDLQVTMCPQFTDNFATPSFQNGRYYLGTTISSMTIPDIKCVALNVTASDWRAIINWLSPSAVGELVFNFNVGTYYMVKLSTSPTANMTPRSKGNSIINDTMVIEFTLSFTTIGDYAALGCNCTTGMKTYIEGTTHFYNKDDVTCCPYYFPQLYIANQESSTYVTYYIFNTGTLDMYPVLMFDNISGSTIECTINGVSNKYTHNFDFGYNLSSLYPITLNTKYNIATFNNNKLIGSTSQVTNEIQSMQSVPSGCPELRLCSLTYNGNSSYSIELESPVDPTRFTDSLLHYGICFFSGIDTNYTYNNDTYGMKPYPISLLNSFMILGSNVDLQNSSVIANGTLISFHCTSPQLGTIPSTLQTAGDKIFGYVSLCNYTIMTIEITGEMPSFKGDISLQSRSSY